LLGGTRQNKTEHYKINEREKATAVFMHRNRQTPATGFMPWTETVTRFAKSQSLSQLRTSFFLLRRSFHRHERKEEGCHGRQSLRCSPSTKGVVYGSRSFPPVDFTANTNGAKKNITQNTNTQLTSHLIISTQRFIPLARLGCRASQHFNLTNTQTTTSLSRLRVALSHQNRFVFSSPFSFSHRTRFSSLTGYRGEGWSHLTLSL